jgi:hypothetical protein
MALNDIFSVKLTGTYLGKNVISQFFYRQTVNDIGGVGTAVELGERFFTVVALEIMQASSEEYTITQTETIGIRAPATFNYLDTFSQDGDLTALGAPSPAWLAQGYRYARVAPGQRYGYKRFPAPPGDFIDGNNTITAFQTTYADPLAAALGADLTAAGLTFTPFIASRPIVYGVQPTGYDAGGVTYRGLTSQNTRK